MRRRSEAWNDDTYAERQRKPAGSCRCPAPKRGTDAPRGFLESLRLSGPPAGNGQHTVWNERHVTWWDGLRACCACGGALLLINTLPKARRSVTRVAHTGDHVSPVIDSCFILLDSRMAHGVCWQRNANSALAIGSGGAAGGTMEVTISRTVEQAHGLWVSHPQLTRWRFPAARRG